MALSGKWTKLFANNDFELILTWSGTQNIASNNTTITAILSIRGVNSWSSVSDGTASETKITINGNTKTFSAYSTVGGGKTKELGRHTVTVPHDANGTKSTGITGSHYWDINWSSTGSQTPSTGGTASLNTIARASTGSGTAFAFTSNSSISINRASTSFTHRARFHVDGLFIKEITGLTTSGTFSFTDAERINIITKMANRTSVQCRVDLWTYNGSTQIGSMYQFYYNVTSPAKASATVADFEISTAGFPVSVVNFNAGAKFTYTASWSYGSLALITSSFSSSSFTFPLTQTNVNDMLGVTPNTNGTWGTLIVKSFYDGVQFGGDTTIKDINARINTTTYAPDIKGGSTFKDTNTNTVAVTGDNQVVVKALSSVSVTLPANLGTAKGGATLAKIRVALGGTTKDIDYVATATTVELGATNASSNSNLTVVVIDSRGNTGTWVTPVTVINYVKPSLSPVVERVDNYETSTAVNLSGQYTRATIAGADKNGIASVTYRYKQTTSSIWSAYSALSYSATGGNITSPATSYINLDNTYSWNLEITATDRFKEATSIIMPVPEGIPILFIDSVLKSVGVGKFPSKQGAFEVRGTIDLEGRLTVAPDTWADKGGALNLNNSDVVGANGIYFGALTGTPDPSDNDGEGLLFARSGTNIPVSGEIDRNTGWDTLRVRDGVGYLNSIPMFNANQAVPGALLWSGAFFMQDGQRITPSSRLTQCPNGWVLKWEWYSGGAKQGHNFMYTMVPKSMEGRNGGFNASLHWGSGAGSTAVKYLYFNSDGQIVGHTQNGQAPANQFVLSEVYAW